MSARVLVAEDDPAVAEMLMVVLRQEGFDTASAADGIAALDAARSYAPDVILLDLMLPGMDGIEVCERIRSESGVPIIMVTAKTEPDDIVRGLESGADDYVVKPFRSREVVARVRARLRRADMNADIEQVQLCDLTIDVAAHEVTRGGTPLPVTPLEFDLLVTLARHPGQVFTREALLNKVWGYVGAGVVDTRLVNVHIQRLRSKVERDPDHPELIQTVWGVGYKAARSPDDA